MVIELQEVKSIMIQLAKDSKSIRKLSSMQRKGKEVESTIKYLEKRKSILMEKRNCLYRELEPFLNTFSPFDRQMLTAYYFSAKSPQDVHAGLQSLDKNFYKSHRTMMRRIEKLLQTPPEYR